GNWEDLWALQRAGPLASGRSWKGTAPPRRSAAPVPWGPVCRECRMGPRRTGEYPQPPPCAPATAAGGVERPGWVLGLVTGPGLPATQRRSCTVARGPRAARPPARPAAAPRRGGLGQLVTQGRARGEAQLLHNGILHGRIH